MKVVIFGLTVSSSWGNGHATLWRGLCAALSRRGHEIVFFEWDAPWYANARDLDNLPGSQLVLYPGWADIETAAREHARSADAVIVTSYCPDALAAGELTTNGLKIFYDLDTPVTLARLAAGDAVDYVGPRGYSDYDLVLSYTGGRALEELRTTLGARLTAPLYGSVDPAVHHPGSRDKRYQATLSYMGTWSADRDVALQIRFIETARRLPDHRFLIGGSKYESSFPWLPNIYFVNHIAPAEHSAFYCSATLTLNVTRGPMAAMGYCPSGRLFEAAACGVPIVSDTWEGIDAFYEPGNEILLTESTEDVLRAISLPSAELARIGRAARERTMDCHTATTRAIEFERVISAAAAHETREATCGA